MSSDGKVLFTSQRHYLRAENIKAAYDAYPGQKSFLQLDGRRKHPMIRQGNFKLMVTDEYPGDSPGKVIMIGHGIDGGKTYGFDQPNTYISERDTRLITWYVTGGQGQFRW